MTGGRRGEPYVELRPPYESEGIARLLGRDRESHEVAALWLSNRLLTLHGSSGVGKTSLVHAGVLPIVRADAEALPIGWVSRGSTLTTAVTREYNPYTLTVLSSWSPGGTLVRLSGLSIRDFLARRATRTDRYGDPVPLLVAIDQFENFFEDSPDRWVYRDEFMNQLAVAAREIPQLRLLIVIRDDSLAALFPYENLIAGHARARFHLRPITRNSAIEAVIRSLEDTSRRFAPGAAESLVDNLRTISVRNIYGETMQVMAESLEPAHLRVVCSELRRCLPADVQEITPRHLHDYGDADRTLARFCADVIARVSDHHNIPASELGQWLEAVFITELDTRGTAYEGLSTTATMPNPVVHALENHRILKSEMRARSRWYELAHDRLIEPIRRMNQHWLTRSGAAVDISAAAYLRAAERAFGDGELTLAEKHAEEALRLSAGGDDMRIQAEAESFLGTIAVQRNRWQDAEYRYRRATEMFQALHDRATVGRLLAEIGGVLLKQRRYASAIEELQAAVTRLPGEIPVQIGLARAFTHSGQARAAVALYGDVLTVAPESAEALSGRGQVLADLGDAVAALEDLHRLIALHPEYEVRSEVRSARGLALAGLGRTEEASVVISGACRDAPDSGTVLLRAAKVARAAGDMDKARDLARRALSAAEPLFPHQADEARNLSRA